MKLALISAVVSEPTALSASPLSPLLTNCPFPSALQSLYCYPPHIPLSVCVCVCATFPWPLPLCLPRLCTFLCVCVCVLWDKANLHFPASAHICRPPSPQRRVCVCVCNLRSAALLWVCVCVCVVVVVVGGKGEGVKTVAASGEGGQASPSLC